jgi:hypothetical protein
MKNNYGYGRLWSDTRYDSLGNCIEDLSEKHKEDLMTGNYRRSAGLCICPDCGKEYYSHPYVKGALWLTELCNGDLVKL